MNEDAFVKKRYSFDRRLKYLGMMAVSIACLFLVVLLSCIVFKASSAFTVYEIKVDLTNSSITNEDEANKFLRQFISPELNQLDFFSITAQEEMVNYPLKGELWLLASAKLNTALTNGEIENFSVEARQIITKLQKQNLIKKRFNYAFFSSKESREPEIAGILTSFIGSMYTILVCLMVALPISVCAAIYLEEFAPKNLLTTLVEININNLAAVPSIVFGLLGLAILINFFGFPRSAPITAGVTLAMMIFPAMIITTRQAFRTIPLNIKHAALALGATKTQIIMHHTLPLAIPGIMTGVILSIARAIGETAPLILIGMLAFIVDVPHSVFDPATVMPVQIFLWADSPEQAFQAKTSAAILILLGILVLINMVAVYIRKKYEHRW